MDNDMRNTLQAIVNLSTEEKLSLAYDSMSSLAAELKEKFPADKAFEIIIAIFSTSVGADGKLTPQEFALVKAFLSAIGNDVDDESLVKVLAAFSCKDACEVVVMLNKVLSIDGQTNLVALVSVICAIDDRIDSDEIQFITDVYEG